MSISLAQYLLYLQYMLSGVALTVAFAFLYVRITPINEFEHIREGNTACALSFGGALLGYAITIASSIAHSVSLVDFLLWGVAATVIQILVYFVCIRFVRNAPRGLAHNNTAIGALLCIAHLAIGILNAASLT